MARVPAGVKELIELSKLGEFSLPEELVESYDACVSIQQLTIETLNVLDINSAAEQIISIALSGEATDLLSIGRDIQAGNNDRSAVDLAQRAKNDALERAGDELTSLAHDMADDIIANYLRPAFTDVLDKARGPADVVRKHAGVTPKDLRLSESEAVRAVRSALRALEPLAERRSAITAARVRVNRLGNRTPQHDSENLFAELRTPQALAPSSWSANSTARLPYPEIPRDQIERLVWLLGDGLPAGPWLPTVAEQDEAWLFLFGEGLAKRKAAAAGWGTIIAN